MELDNHFHSRRILRQTFLFLYQTTCLSKSQADYEVIKLWEKHLCYKVIQHSEIIGHENVRCHKNGNDVWSVNDHIVDHNRPHRFKYGYNTNTGDCISSKK